MATAFHSRENFLFFVRFTQQSPDRPSLNLAKNYGLATICLEYLVSGKSEVCKHIGLEIFNGPSAWVCPRIDFGDKIEQKFHPGPEGQRLFMPSLTILGPKEKKQILPPS